MIVDVLSGKPATQRQPSYTNRPVLGGGQSKRNSIVVHKRLDGSSCSAKKQLFTYDGRPKQDSAQQREAQIQRKVGKRLEDFERYLAKKQGNANQSRQNNQGGFKSRANSLQRDYYKTEYNRAQLERDNSKENLKPQDPNIPRLKYQLNSGSS